MGWIALQKLRLKDLVCTPIYRKLSPGVSHNKRTPLRVLVGFILLIPCRPRQPHADPLDPRPLGVLLLLKVGVARGAAYPHVARPRGACQRVGPTWEDPRSGWVWSWVVWVWFDHSSDLNLTIYPKPGSNREGKSAYMV